MVLNRATERAIGLNERPPAPQPEAAWIRLGNRQITSLIPWMEGYNAAWVVPIQWQVVRKMLSHLQGLGKLGGEGADFQR